MLNLYCVITSVLVYPFKYTFTKLVFLFILFHPVQWEIKSLMASKGRGVVLQWLYIEKPWGPVLGQLKLRGSITPPVSIIPCGSLLISSFKGNHLAILSTQKSAPLILIPSPLIFWGWGGSKDQSQQKHAAIPGRIIVWSVRGEVLETRGWSPLICVMWLRNAWCTS